MLKIQKIKNYFQLIKNSCLLLKSYDLNIFRNQQLVDLSIIKSMTEYKIQTVKFEILKELIISSIKVNKEKTEIEFFK